MSNKDQNVPNTVVILKFPHKTVTVTNTQASPLFNAEVGELQLNVEFFTPLVVAIIEDYINFVVVAKNEGKLIGYL
jgi:hypothetical protein